MFREGAAPLWSTTTKDIQAELGASTALYFSFLKTISVLFALMTLASLPSLFLMVRARPSCFKFCCKPERPGTLAGCWQPFVYLFELLCP